VAPVAAEKKELPFGPPAPTISALRGGENSVELKDSQYAGAQRMLNSATTALQMAEAGVKRKEEPRSIGRKIEEVELFLKKAKRELRIG